jgi:RNA-binding protein
MLTPTFIKTLLVKGQQIKPVIIIGANGLTDQVHKELASALLAHELIKIRVNAESRELRDEMVSEILKQHEAAKIQQIGHILVIYKHNPDKKKK